jgi:hypothetical protein
MSITLQRRHFQFLALALFELKGKMTASEHANVVIHMADKLRSTNAGFKYQRFVDWCNFGHTPRRRYVPPSLTGAGYTGYRAIDRAMKAKAKEADDGGYWE